MELTARPSAMTPARKAWLVASGAAVMICLGTVYSWSVFRLHVETFYQVGAVLSGLPYMVSLAFYALFMYLSGRRLDGLDPRLTVSLGGLLVAAGWILSAFAPNIWVLTLTYGALSGTGVGIVYGVPMAATAKWFPEKKGLAVGLVLAGFGLSPLVTAPLARRLVAAYGMSDAFWILGAAFGILIPLFSLSFRYPEEGETEDAEKTEGLDTPAMLRSKAFRPLYLNFLIGAMIGLMMIGMTAGVGVDHAGLAPGTIGLFLPLFALFNGAGRPLFGWMTDRFSTDKAMAASYGLILSASLIMLLLGNGALSYGIAFSLFWMNLGGWLAIAPGATIRLFGQRHYSANYGLVFTAYGIGALLGVSASGLLVDFFGGYRIVFAFVAFLSLTGLFLARRMKKII